MTIQSEEVAAAILLNPLLAIPLIAFSVTLVWWGFGRPPRSVAYLLTSLPGLVILWATLQMPIRSIDDFILASFVLIPTNLLAPIVSILAFGSLTLWRSSAPAAKLRKLDGFAISLLLLAYAYDQLVVEGLYLQKIAPQASIVGDLLH